MRRRASSHDVARLAGVSQSTVSLVLSKRIDARISDTTRERILAAAKELNYHTHSAAKALVTGRTHRIGIVPNKPDHFDIHNAYYYNIMAGMMRGAACENYNLLLHAASYHDWQALHQDIMSGAADGVILIGREKNDSLTNALLDSHFPTVCVSYNPGREDCYIVDCDNEQCGALAVQHLLELDHKRIMFLYQSIDNSWTRERMDGAIRAVHAAGYSSDILISRDMTQYGKWDHTWVENLVRDIETQPSRPSAIICFDEFLAHTLAEILPGNSFRIPEDIALVSCNSTEISARSKPPITSVFQPLISIGEAAVRLLSDILEGREIDRNIKRFPVHLDIRESCGWKKTN